MATAKRTNTTGIPCMSGVGNVSGTSLVVTFPETSVGQPKFSGVVAVRLTGTFSATATQITVLFNMGSHQSKTVLFEGSDANGSMFPAPGIYLVFIDQESGTITLV